MFEFSHEASITGKGAAVLEVGLWRGAKRRLEESGQCLLFGGNLDWPKTQMSTNQTILVVTFHKETDQFSITIKRDLVAAVFSQFNSYNYINLLYS
jgi:hypothetical protein